MKIKKNKIIGDFMNYGNKGRPCELIAGRQTTIYLSQEIVQQAKSMNINISEVCRNALSEAVNSEDYKIINETEKKLSPLPINRKKKIMKLLQDGKEASERWAMVINRDYGIEVTPEELSKWSGY